MNVLVITGLTLPEVTEADRDMILAAGGPGTTVTVVSKMREAIQHAPTADVVLGVLPEPLFEAATNLKWVHASASGVDMFLYPAFRDSPIPLSGEKGLVGGHLADHGFGLLLALTRRIATAIRLGRDAWVHREDLRVTELELEGMTMGIFGFGGTGRAMARRADAFGMRMLAVDEMAVAGSDGVTDVWPTTRLAEMLGASDVVAICCPLTDATRMLFDDRVFAQMRRGALLVNVTRGEVVDDGALVRALQSGQLGGAALDVVAGEPLAPDHPLWEFENVVMTPHTAGASQHRARRNFERFCDNLRRFQAGEPLVGVIDKLAGF